MKSDEVLMELGQWLIDHCQTGDVGQRMVQWGLRADPNAPEVEVQADAAREYVRSLDQTYRAATLAASHHLDESDRPGLKGVTLPVPTELAAAGLSLRENTTLVNGSMAYVGPPPPSSEFVAWKGKAVEDGFDVGLVED